jgi:hypothetical protein
MLVPAFAGDETAETPTSERDATTKIATALLVFLETKSLTKLCMMLPSNSGVDLLT